MRLNKRANLTKMLLSAIRKKYQLNLIIKLLNKLNSNILVNAIGSHLRSGSSSAVMLRPSYDLLLFILKLLLLSLVSLLRGVAVVVVTATWIERKLF